MPWYGGEEVIGDLGFPIAEIRIEFGRQQKLLVSVIIGSQELVLEVAIHAAEVKNQDIADHIRAQDRSLISSKHRVEVRVLFARVGVEILIRPQLVVSVRMEALDAVHHVAPAREDSISFPGWMDELGCFLHHGLYDSIGLLRRWCLFIRSIPLFFPQLRAAD